MKIPSHPSKLNSFFQFQIKFEVTLLLFLRYKKLNGALASFIEDYSLVHFTPLNVRDRRSLLNVQNLVDKANGYIFKCEEERNIHKLLSSVMVNAENDTNVETEDTCHPEEGPESTLFNYTL